MTVWFTSDTHFCHKKVAELRGFKFSNDHDDHVIQTWNHYVALNDLVWLLGDVGIGRDEVILDRVAGLNGRKHLVAGNHDSVWPALRDARKHQQGWLSYFDSVQPFARQSILGEDFLLSHFPYEGDHGDRDDRATQYRLRDEGMPLLHGHLHCEQRVMSVDRRIVHVGWDAWHRPVSDKEIKELLNG